MSLDRPQRVILVSTPRSGNTWIRKLIASVYQLPEMAEHHLTDAQWQALPAEVILQLHWRREPDFLTRLRNHDFRIVTIARHPLDVLISILHVVVYDVESEHWLLGKNGDERCIWGAMPRSRSFLKYACSPRATELLSITTDWWQQPGVVSLRYEDFVADTAGAIRNLESQLGPATDTDFSSIIQRHTLDRLRRTATNNHFWQGKPGLWRALLTTTEIEELHPTLSPFAERLGYELQPDPALTPDEADRNWIELVGPELRRTLDRNTEAHQEQLHGAHIAVQTAKEQIRFLEEALAQKSTVHEILQAEVARLQDRERTLLEDLSRASNHIHYLETIYGPLRGLQGLSLKIAQRVQAFRDRFPRLFEWFKGQNRTD